MVRRAIIRFQSAQMEKRRQAGKALSAALEKMLAKGKSIEEISNELRVSYMTVYRWLTNTRIPRYPMIDLFERKYGVKIL